MIFYFNWLFKKFIFNIIIDVLTTSFMLLLFYSAFFPLCFPTVVFFWVIRTFLMHFFLSFNKAGRNTIKLSKIIETVTALKKIKLKHV